MTSLPCVCLNMLALLEAAIGLPEVDSCITKIVQSLLGHNEIKGKVRSFLCQWNVIKATSQNMKEIISASIDTWWKDLTTVLDCLFSP